MKVSGSSVCVVGDAQLLGTDEDLDGLALGGLGRLVQPEAPGSA